MIKTGRDTNASSFSFTDHPNYNFIGDIYGQPSYVIRAYFPNGSHSDSQSVTVYKSSLTVQASMIRGPSRQRYLALQSPPFSLSRIRLFHPLTNNYYPFIEIYATNFTGGIAQVPQSFLDAYAGSAFWAQAIATNGDFGDSFQVLTDYIAEDQDYILDHPYASGFIDLRRHLIFVDCLSKDVRHAGQRRECQYRS